ncbi:MAG: exosortase/archaeosortase family protein [Candidatus Bathyarchaeia archaeon]
MKKSWFHITLLVSIAIPILLLLFLDYCNFEGYNYVYNAETKAFDGWSNVFFNQNFLFGLTWKGRMFLLVFLWLFLIESALDWHNITDETPKRRSIILASLICALFPMFYVVAINFLGLDLALLQFGRDIGIRSITPENQPWDFLYLQWPISCEYVVFTLFSVGAVLLAYKTRGLKYFSISFALLGGIALAYMFDTVYPFGVFRPLQAFALPTAAVAAALLDLLGYAVQLTFPVYAFDSYLPSLAISMDGQSASVIIAWACAGVQSLLLYIVIIHVFFKKAELSAFRKLAYFIIGLFGTFFVNVFRVISILLIMLNQGRDAGMVFHNTYGEMYSVIWILLYVLLIGFVQRFMLVERSRYAFSRICAAFQSTKNRIMQRPKSEIADEQKV